MQHAARRQLAHEHCHQQRIERVLGCSHQAHRFGQRHRRQLQRHRLYRLRQGHRREWAGRHVAGRRTRKDQLLRRHVYEHGSAER